MRARAAVAASTSGPKIGLDLRLQTILISIARSCQTINPPRNTLAESVHLCVSDVCWIHIQIPDKH